MYEQRTKFKYNSCSLGFSLKIEPYDYLTKKYIFIPWEKIYMVKSKYYLYPFHQKKTKKQRTKSFFILFFSQENKIVLDGKYSKLSYLGVMWYKCPVIASLIIGTQLLLYPILD